ncbi:MAG: hypothetical protein Q9175_008152 [Cornicularia normoerica]
MPCLWSLHMPMRKKILMMGVFATGFLACITSIVRTYYSFQVAKSSDKSYKLELMGLWGWAELAIGIIVGCLPVMPKFIQQVGPKVLKSLSFRSKYKLRPARNLEIRVKAPSGNAFTRIQQPFAKDAHLSISESLIDPYSPPAQFQGDCLTRGIFDSPISNAIIAHESTQPPGVVFASRGDDLEYGRK